MVIYLTLEGKEEQILKFKERANYGKKIFLFNNFFHCPYPDTKENKPKVFGWRKKYWGTLKEAESPEITIEGKEYLIYKMQVGNFPRNFCEYASIMYEELTLTVISKNWWEEEKEMFRRGSRIKTEKGFSVDISSSVTTITLSERQIEQQRMITTQQE